MAIQVIVRREENQWLADVPECPGVHTFGGDLKHLESMVREALGAYLDLDDTASIDLHMDVVDAESTH